MPSRLWLLLLLAWLFPPISHGAEESGQEVDDFAELDLEELLDVVVSASKREQEIMEAPSSMTVIGREEIEASGARTLPEALRVVPGMDIQLVKPLWYVVGVRGNSSLTSETMLLLVDGRDLTVEFFGFPPWTAQSISMDDVERIEVVRGPGSALYGANAYSGVVHVITRRPGSEPRVLASIRGAEKGLLELNLRGSQSIGSHAFAASAGAAQQDFWTGRDQLGRRLYRGRLDGVIKLGEETEIQLDAGIARVEGTIYASVGEADIESLQKAFARAKFRWQDFILAVVYDRMDVQAGVDMPLIFGDIEIARLPAFDADVNKLGVSFQHAIEVFHNQLVYGAEYVYNDYWADILTDPFHSEHRVGFFLQDELDLGAILGKSLPMFITAGLRYDYNSISEAELSPRAALVYRPAKDHSLRLGYAHAFLKPSFFQTSLHVNVESDLGIEEMDVTAKDLSNQVIDCLELGYHGRFFDNRLNVQLDLAYSWYADNIWFKSDPSQMRYIEIGGFRIPDINGGGFGFYNDPGGKKGHNIELQVDFRPIKEVRLFLNTGYRQMFDRESGAFKISEPVWTLAAGADLGVLQNLTASLRFYYTSEFIQEVANPESFLEPFILLEVPPVYFLNARIAWTIVSGPLNLVTGLEAFNLLDQSRRAYPGITQKNGTDYAGERPSRRIGVFLRGEL